MNLSELGLTPTQHAEIETHHPAYVQAWLNALEQTHDIKTPAAWFLAAIRSGRLPGEHTHTDQAKAVHLAEQWITNAGHYEPSEASLIAALFDKGGRLHPWKHDQQLRNRITTYWQQHQSALPSTPSPLPTQTEQRTSNPGNQANPATPPADPKASRPKPANSSETTPHASSTSSSKSPTTTPPNQPTVSPRSANTSTAPTANQPPSHPSTAKTPSTSPNSPKSDPS